MTKEKEGTGTKAITLPIKWNVPESIITRFASHILIQTIENEFKISFFEINPEIRMAASDKIPSEVKANCVSSIIIGAHKLPSLIAALQKHLDMFNETKKESKK